MDDLLQYTFNKQHNQPAIAASIKPVCHSNAGPMLSRTRPKGPVFKPHNRLIHPNTQSAPFRPHNPRPVSPVPYHYLTTPSGSIKSTIPYTGSANFFPFMTFV